MIGLHLHLESNATNNPGAPALIQGDLVWSWHDLWLESRQKASALASLGIGRGDKLLLALNARNYLAASFACIHLGAIAIPLTRRETSREVENIHAELVPLMGLVDDETASIMTFPASQTMVSWNRLSADAAPPVSTAQSGDTTVIHFSSGSTGRPKPIPRSYRNISLEGASVAEAIALGPDDIVLCTTPLQHSYAGGLMAACVRAGAALAIVEDFKPSSILDFAGRVGATMLAGTPYLFRALGALRQNAAADLTRLRFGIVGGAYLPVEFVRAFEDKFHKPLIQEYGLSEGGITSFNTVSYLTKPTSIGRPIPGVSMAVVAESGEPAAVGTQGELIVSREAMPSVYLNHDEESRRAFSGNSVRTGDLAYVDADGDFFIVGRIKQMINVSGNKVSPTEVMEVLMSSGLVEDAAVIALAHADLGEVVGAMVVARPRDGESRAAISEILHHCRGKLAAHKVPRKLSLCAELPRLANGKVDFATVRTQLQTQ